MRRRVVLANCNVFVGVFEYRSSVLVHIEIVGSREDGYYGWKIAFWGLGVYRVSGILSFMSSNDGEQVVSFQELTDSVVSGVSPPRVNLSRMQKRCFSFDTHV